jgi:GDPmannose 4,6-dehydratase
MINQKRIPCALIFGSSGQDGIYTAKLLRSQGYHVVGLSRSAGDMIMDISDHKAVEELIKNYKPNYIFHYAAYSTTKHDVLYENHAIISGGTLNILESVRRYSLSTKVFITGSGVQFINTGESICENNTFEATSPYAAERIASVYLARYFRTLGVKAYVGYLFHHESPYRKPSHVSQRVAQAVHRIAKGADEILEIGSISVEKEWIFAGDVVQAIMTLMLQENVFESVIGTGKGYTIENWLDVCFGLENLDWRKYTRVAESFVPEYKRLVSNPKTIFSLGWRPKTSFKQLAYMMVKYAP